MSLSKEQIYSQSRVSLIKAKVQEQVELKGNYEERIKHAIHREMEIRKEFARVKEDAQMRKKMLKEIEERESQLRMRQAFY